jgi:hypothetical protein
MADDNDSVVLYTAVYGSVDDALSDLDAIESLHSEQIIGKFDAAVIDQESGEPHIVKRMDRPRVRVIPEEYNHGALPRAELKDAAKELEPGQAGLIVAGEPTLEQGFDKAVTKAAKVVKQSLDATTDEIAQEMKESAAS